MNTKQIRLTITANTEKIQQLQQKTAPKTQTIKDVKQKEKGI
jgi:hypothetical protein